MTTQEEGLTGNGFGEIRTSIYPQIPSNSMSYIQYIENRIGTYCMNNGRMIYVDAKGNTYITPFCLDVEEMLDHAGFTRYDMFVPLSNGETIVNQQLNEQWDEMCRKARERSNQRVREEREHYCQSIAAHKEVEELPKEAYLYSMRIPEEGLTTQLFMSDEKKVSYPIYQFECQEKVGTYCNNNGIIIFVDAKGDSYITPFNVEIREMLTQAGYQPGAIFVPMSNGETITNPGLNQQWNNMCVVAAELHRKYSQGDDIKPKR